MVHYLNVVSLIDASVVRWQDHFVTVEQWTHSKAVELIKELVNVKKMHGMFPINFKC